MADTISGGGGPFELRKIRQLVQLMREHDLAEIDLRQGEMRIRLRRQGATIEKVVSAPPPTAAAPAAPVAAVGSGSTGPVLAPRPADTEQSRYIEIKSPMVGTFYAAPSPEVEPFVHVGSELKPETVVCVIEAMKVFNEIPAEVSGRVVEILVDNGEPVEFGQPLFRVDPGA